MSDSVAHPVLKDVVCSKKKYAYALLQGKSVWNAEKGYCDKEKQIQIGSIRESDGIGECIFNERFLSENPQFRRWRVFRVVSTAERAQMRCASLRRLSAKQQLVR